MIKRRNTRQRQLVLEAVRSLHNHPTAEEVFQEVRRLQPNISLGTVYRNLNLLAQEGEILSLGRDMEKDHFDGCNARHPHMICTVCGRVVDLEGLDVQPIFQQAQQCCGQGRITGVNLMFQGVCAQCAQEGRPEETNVVPLPEGESLHFGS